MLLETLAHRTDYVNRFRGNECEARPDFAEVGFLWGRDLANPEFFRAVPSLCSHVVVPPLPLPRAPYNGRGAPCSRSTVLYRALRPITCIRYHAAPLWTDAYRCKATYPHATRSHHHRRGPHPSAYHAQSELATLDRLATFGVMTRTVARQHAAARAMLLRGGSHTQPQQWRKVSHVTQPHVSTVYGVASTRPICCAPYVIPYARARVRCDVSRCDCVMVWRPVA